MARSKNQMKLLTVELIAEPEPEPDESMDGDAGSALASAGMGVDEDYGHYENGEERDGEDYEGRMWGND